MPPRCKNLIACIDSFKKQTGQILIKGNDLKINTYVAATKDLKEVTKKKEPYRISVAYPTMFHSTADPEWEDFIRKTVEGAYIDHSDNNIKQDNNTEPSGST